MFIKEDYYNLLENNTYDDFCGVNIRSFIHKELLFDLYRYY